MKKIVFFGSSHFASECLRTLHSADDIEVCLVISQPDKPFGRKKVLKPTPVSECALELGLKLERPPSLKKLAPLYMLRELDYDLGVVVAYGQIIPQRVLDTASVAFINGHASDLPRFRGAAPMERALIEGDLESALCIMKMSAGLDEGPVLARYPIDLSGKPDIFELESLMLKECQRGLLEVIRDVENHLAQAKEQSNTGVSYAQKLSVEDAYVNLEDRTSHELDCRLRGLKRSYGLIFSWKGKKFIVWDACFETGAATDVEPGTVIKRTKKELGIAVIDGLMSVKIIQVEGKKKLELNQFLAGSPIQEGDKIDSFSI